MVAENTKAPNFVSRAFQSESENLTLSERAKVYFAGPPEIHLGEIFFRRKKIEPSIVSVREKEIDHV